jgi:hypothetical protein
MPRRPARTDGGRTAHASLSRDGDRRHARASGGLQRDRGLHRAAAKLRGAPLRSVALGLVQPATKAPRRHPAKETRRVALTLGPGAGACRHSTGPPRLAGPRVYFEGSTPCHVLQTIEPSTTVREPVTPCGVAVRCGCYSSTTIPGCRTELNRLIATEPELVPVAAAERAPRP